MTTKVIITLDGTPNLGCEILEDDKHLVWQEMSWEQQVSVVNALLQFGEFFQKHVKAV